MEIVILGWVLLITLLCLTTFGFFWCFTVLIGCVTFLIGLLTVLYLQHANLENYLDSGLLENPLEDRNTNNGIKNIVSTLSEKRPRTTHKTDSRLTGSDVIDRALRDIVTYILRDYVHSWYNKITNLPNDDERSFDKAIRSSIQYAVSRVSERVKEVDWLSFLTTKLVDKVAEHIKLYRQAQQECTSLLTTNSSKISPKTSPKKHIKTHRRNKSDTDVKWNSSGQSNIQTKFYTDHQNADNQIKSDNIDEEAVELFLSKDSRGRIVSDERTLEEHLTSLVDLVLFFVLPAEDFACPSLRSILGSIISCFVLRPLFDLLSEPDTVNLIILKICCKDGPPAGEHLLTTLRFCNDVNELSVMREMLRAEIHQLRSSSSTHADSSIKQQIGSLQYGEKMVNNKLGQLKGNIEPDTSASTILPLLSFEQLLSGDVALSFYLDYLTQVNKQNYLFFYNTVEHWKTSVREQSQNKATKMRNIRNGSTSSTNANTSNGNNNNNALSTNDELRETAQKIYEKFLSEHKSDRVEVPSQMLNDLRLKIANKALIPSENWFDEIQDNVFGKFKTEDIFLTDFYRSRLYIHMLAELDMLTHGQHDYDCTSNLDNDSISSLEMVAGSSETDSGGAPDIDFCQSVLENDKLSECVMDGEALKHKVPLIQQTNADNNGYQKPKEYQFDDKKLSTKFDYMKHTRSRSDSIVRQRTLSPLRHNIKSGDYQASIEGSVATAKFAFEHYNASFLADNYDLTMEIIQTAIACEGGRSWGVYALNVLCHRKKVQDGSLNSRLQNDCSSPLLQWHVYRRYSHFLDLQKSVKKKYPDLSKLPFPAKRAFHNMDRTVLEHRKTVLNTFISALCEHARRIKHHTLTQRVYYYDGLLEMLIEFCEPQAYDKQVAKGAMIRTIDTIVSPLRSGMRSIKNMPDQLLNSVDEFVGGLSRVLLGVPDEIDADNPAIRSALVLLDEAFDLKGRSQWLRRGVLSKALQGTWLGTVVNRRLLQLAGSLAGHGMVLQAISYVRNALWPNGERAQSQPKRDQDTVHRTRIAAKTALLASFSEDLKHVLGSETTRIGLLNVCLLLQKKQLNVRLILVVFEDILTALYPNIGKALIAKNINVPPVRDNR
uniref:Putative sorting nexin-13-like isoform x1 n=1 Tax=Xenopsylla cheopis TaxID=163159 RepID=A0A6M2DLF5_XENCH